MAKNFIRRGDWYYYYRRVPKHVSFFDKRKHIRIALKTKVEKEAGRLAAIYDDFMEQYWSDLIRSNRTDDDKALFTRASATARTHGFAYKHMTAILASPLSEIVSRVEAAHGKDEFTVSSLLGTVPSHSPLLSQCMAIYWPLCVDRFTDKTDHQIRKYKNPRELAMRNFIEAVGDMEIHKLNRYHILEFRNWLLGRIAADEITGHTANKRMGHVKDVLVTVGMDQQIDVDFKHLFSETRLQQRSKVRPPFEAEFVQKRWIDAMPFDSLEAEARMLVYLMMDTGARESELIGLLPEDIQLNTPIPFIWIRNNELRSLKTQSSYRKVPLVGMSMYAAGKIYPSGFQRYHGRPDLASNEINKYLRENELKPTDQHSLYSLRHTFKDRLRDAGAPEEVIQELMGHAKQGPQYGRGHTLETKCKWLQKIAYKVPLSCR